MGKLNIDIVAEPYINKSGFCTDLIFEDGYNLGWFGRIDPFFVFKPIKFNQNA